MTTQIAASTSAAISLTQHNAQHVFKMSDARLVAIWNDAGTIRRSTSTDAGVTWSAPSTIFSTGDSGGYMAACVNGDTIYGGFTRLGNTFMAFKMAYATGAFTDTSAAIAMTPDPASNITPATAAHAVWDSVKGNFHFAVAWYFSGTQAAMAIFAVSTSLTKISQTSARTDINGGESGYALLVDTAGTPNIYWFVANTVTTITTTRMYPFTWNGTTYTAGTAEDAVGSASTDVSAAFDQSGNVDLFYKQGSSILTRKRTGVNTYGSATTLVSGVNNGGGTGRMGAAVSRTGNVNGDLLLFYRRDTDQANGEIYVIKRTSGTWGAPTRVAGGTSGGWDHPTTIDLIQGDGIAYLLYLTGTSTYALIFDGSVTTGTAPSAPINVLPSGNANGSLTPTISCTYKNGSPSDALGSYQVLVVRQSDSVTMWDSTKTAYGGSTIIDGGTFSIAYGGSALAKGVVYQLQVRFWDANSNLQGVYNTAVTFSVNDTPSVAITSSASPTGSGPTVTWTYSQAQSHAQASYRIVVKDAADATTLYDSGTVASAALSAAIPQGTLRNGVTAQLHITVLSTDGL